MRAYADEAELQALIVDSPQLVTGEDSVAVVLRELALPAAGSLDVLIVHRNGDLTLVEAKLNRNAEIRRAVVGQLLGYAGGLWRLGYERLDDAVRRQHNTSLAELAQAAADDDPFEADEFRSTVTRNLDDGAFRLVFAVDEITEDLKRAVEYLNAHTVDGTTAVVMELDYSKVGDVEILIPRSYGEEAAQRKRVSRARNRWTEADLFKTLEADASAEEVAAARELYDWASSRVHRLWWGEGQSPSVTLVFDTPEGLIQPCAIYTGWTNGVAVNFEWMRKRPTAALHQVLDDLDSLPTVHAMRDEIVAKNFAKRPTVPMAELARAGVPTLTHAIDRLLDHPPADD